MLQAVIPAFLLHISSFRRRGFILFLIVLREERVEVKKGIKPEMYALSTLIFASVLLLLLILNHLPGSEKKA